MKTRFTLILATMTLILNACGSRVDTNVSTLTQPVKVDAIPGASSADNKNAALRGKLSCAFEGECEPAVAMISIATASGLNRCSGFLISATEVMTNDHCLAGSLGADSIFVHFAQIDGSTNSQLTFSLQSVKGKAGDESIARQDYAFLELSEPVLDRAPLKISNRGFNDQETARIFRVQMTNDGTQSGFGGLQNRLDCQASYETYLYPAVKSAKATLMTFGDCAIQHGNSGSPIINSDGDVGVILQGYLLPEKNSKINDDLSSISLDQVYGQVGIGTALFCINNAQCDAIGSLKNEWPLDFLKSQSKKKSPSFEKTDEKHQWAQLKTESPSGSEIFASVPVCENSNGFQAQTASVRAGLNRFMQVEWRKSEVMTPANFTRLTSSLIFNAAAIGGQVSVPRCH